jgi:hypothetical protein
LNVFTDDQRIGTHSPSGSLTWALNKEAVMKC